MYSRPTPTKNSLSPRFCLRGGGGCAEVTNLKQEKGNLDSPPYPQLANQGWANGTFWLSRSFRSSLISWGVFKPCRGVLPGILSGLCRLILQNGRPTLVLIFGHIQSNIYLSNLLIFNAFSSCSTYSRFCLHSEEGDNRPCHGFRRHLDE